VDSDVSVERNELDSIFRQFDNSLSTYKPNSLITQINESTDSISVLDTFGYFGACYQLSSYVYDITKGAFDPSVFPLIKGYGFMDDLETPLSDSLREALLNVVSFEKNEWHRVKFENDVLSYSKSSPEFKLDFNAIAQGLSVDVIAKHLDGKGIENYYLEVGGEIRVKGTNKDGVPWRIGIDVPSEMASEFREMENVLSVSNKAIATSGNYRKFYEKDGKKYAHTIDPKTGLPVQHSLLSATVIANSCALADAYATAFMVVGADSALRIIEANPKLNIKCYLLEADGKDGFTRKMSPGFEQFIAE
jgi:thiamine biosynthesis lipoprotein